MQTSSPQDGDYLRATLRVLNPATYFSSLFRLDKVDDHQNGDIIEPPTPVINGVFDTDADDTANRVEDENWSASQPLNESACLSNPSTPAVVSATSTMASSFVLSGEKALAMSKTTFLDVNPIKWNMNDNNADNPVVIENTVSSSDTTVPLTVFIHEGTVPCFLVLFQVQ